MGSGSNRNQPCWCGSGQKYKHCHLGRAQQVPLSLWDARKEEIKIGSTKTCLHPEASMRACSGPIVRAHTVRRSADLRSIARDGHVYHPESDIAVLNQTGGGAPARLIGINEASTFWGFCQAHDSATFAALEMQPLVPTDEQAFLLAYRPLVKELYLKERYLETLEITRKSDRGKPLGRQLATQALVRGWRLTAEASIRDLKRVKSLFDQDLLARDFTAIRYTTIRFAEPADMVCTGVVQPLTSFAGEKLQDLKDVGNDLHSIAFSLLAIYDESAAVLAWREDADAVCSTFVDSLLALPEVDIPSALVRFCLDKFENVFFRPDWWEGLPADTARALTARFMHGVDPRCGPGADYWEDDGVRAVKWHVKEAKQRRS